jgi:hypothetical protein
VGDKKFKASEVDRSLAKQQLEKRLDLNMDLAFNLGKEDKKRKGMGMSL